MNAANFWTQFWPAVAANFIAGLAVIFIAYILLRKYRQPRFHIFTVVRAESNDYIEFEVLIRNSGRWMVRGEELYWHIFLDSRLEVISATEAADPVKQDVNGQIMMHFGDIVASPIFSGRPQGLICLRIRRPLQSIGKARLHYFLSTAYGLFPTYLQRIRDGETRQKFLPYFAEVSSTGMLPLEHRGLPLLQGLGLRLRGR